MIEEKQFNMSHFAIVDWDISNAMDLYKFKDYRLQAMF